MAKIDFLKKLTEQLTDAIPAHLGTLKKDFEKNCHAILNKTFEKLDIVTREEFDTQTKVLQRSRKKLEELEAKVKQLEESLKKKSKHHD
jgi:BMFP domain-containing protein YqiC